ncbi:hypothetical protein AO268_27250 [Pseudomonas sp. ICMP 8385]|nr:hypothetical protein BLL38_06280 [Pseudomonas gessardii]PHN55093.1 hypothetical protein AO268_27250 [Pseudomonas sp. ICMP 8385]
MLLLFLLLMLNILRMQAIGTWISLWSMIVIAWLENRWMIRKPLLNLGSTFFGKVDTLLLPVIPGAMVAQISFMGESDSSR